MVSYLARKEVLHEAFFKKYAAKKYMKASIFVREWIHRQYAEKEEITILSVNTEIRQVDYEGPGKENTPQGDEQDGSENEDNASEKDDYMYANELEERDIER